ncbi:MAG: hypothetical protein EOO01_25465 [Chitinophagaceae bacterium]|nr:MAG: hypothetical protein EOO01_25465 [Chitinophagaceae bacterium]
MMTSHPISDESFNTLLCVLESFTTLSFKFKLALKAVLHESAFPKDKVILNFKQTQGQVWFMLEGLAREIREDRETLEEQTSWFWQAMTFIYTEPGFFGQQPSSRSIQVIEMSKMLFIGYSDWKLLKDTFPEAERITELIRSYYTLERQQHSEEIKSLGTEERYLNKEDLLQDLFSKKIQSHKENAAALL